MEHLCLEGALPPHARCTSEFQEDTTLSHCPGGQGIQKQRYRVS